MERYYFCNMFIKNNKLIDTEHAEWHRVGSVEKNLESSERAVSAINMEETLSE